MLQNDDDSVAAEPDASDLRPERELADAPGLVVVPHHDFAGRVERVGSASDQGEDLVAEEHLDHSDAPLIGITAEELADGVAVVDAEAGVRGDGEAAVVLVEGQVEELGVLVLDRVGGERAGVVGFGIGGRIGRLH